MGSMVTAVKRLSNPDILEHQVKIQREKQRTSIYFVSSPISFISRFFGVCLFYGFFICLFFVFMVCALLKILCILS